MRTRVRLVAENTRPRLPARRPTSARAFEVKEGYAMDETKTKHPGAIDYSEDQAAEFEAKVVRTRRFRGLLVSFGCLVVLTLSVAFAGVPVAVMAWRYWFGS